MGGARVGAGLSGHATALADGAPEPTRANWRGGPQTKWAFHNVDKMIPVAPENVTLLDNGVGRRLGVRSM